tara:strand:+ start:75 stop:284 length:210 start_codon:yes stop_codon:yes gene_type:complete
MDKQGIEIIKQCISISRLADHLGLTRMAIYQWKIIPSRYVIEIEKITGISRTQLRPDLYKGMTHDKKRD